MVTDHQPTHQDTDLSGGSSDSRNVLSPADGAPPAPTAAVVTTEDIDWLVRRLRAMVTASSVVWAGRGMTLLQLIALHFIRALAPVTPSHLAHVLETSRQLPPR
jgi:hypothetical protein